MVDCELGAQKELRRPLLKIRVLHLAQHSAVDGQQAECAGLEWVVRVALHWDVLMGEQREVEERQDGRGMGPR